MKKKMKSCTLPLQNGSGEDHVECSSQETNTYWTLIRGILRSIVREQQMVKGNIRNNWSTELN